MADLKLAMVVSLVDRLATPGRLSRWVVCLPSGRLPNSPRGCAAAATTAVNGAVSFRVCTPPPQLRYIDAQIATTRIWRRRTGGSRAVSQAPSARTPLLVFCV